MITASVEYIIIESINRTVIQQNGTDTFQLSRAIQKIFPKET
jgi:hypothetical protein